MTWAEDQDDPFKVALEDDICSGSIKELFLYFLDVHGVCNNDNSLVLFLVQPFHSLHSLPKVAMTGMNFF